MRPYVAKSYFEAYKSYDHMQKIRPVSQNFNAILTFENFETLIFCQTLTYKKRSIFDIGAHLLDLVLSLYVLQMIFSLKIKTTSKIGSPPHTIFFGSPSP